MVRADLPESARGLAGLIVAAPLPAAFRTGTNPPALSPAFCYPRMMLAWTLVSFLLQAFASPMTLSRANTSPAVEPKEVVVRTAAEWETLWKSHVGSEPVPVVDFSKDMVAAVFLGMRPTGGFSVEILAARRGPDALIVDYAERRPGPDDIVAQMQTSPFHIVRLPKHDGAVRFEKRPAAAGGR